MYQTPPLQETATAIAGGAPPGVAFHVIGDSPELLREVGTPAVNLCLWQRPVLAEVARELAGLQASDLPGLRSTTSLESFDHDVSTLLQQQGLDPLVFRHWRADLHRLAEMYFSVSEHRKVTLRLVTTDEDDCRRFHVDRTRLRLLCTYRGPGTEWLTEEQVDRAVQTTGAPNDDIIRFGANDSIRSKGPDVAAGSAVAECLIFVTSE